MDLFNTQLSQLTQDVSDEKTNPYEALFNLKELQRKLKNSIEVIEGIAFETATYEDKTFENNGFRIEKRNGRKVWNFKNVEEWTVYDKNKKDCEDRLKAAYSASEKGLNLGDENGEIIPLPKVSFTKDSLIIKKI